MEFLKEQGFKISPDYRVCKNIDEVITAVNDIAKVRDSLYYEIDGAVIKVNEINYREMLEVLQKLPDGL